MKRFRFVYPAIASACLSVASLHAARPLYGGMLRIQTHAAIRSLDPTATPADRDEAVASARLRPLVFETLVRVDPSTGLQPLLAVSWESDRGGARWRFTLRPGVMLHDGTPLETWKVAASLRTTATAWTVSTDGEVLVLDSARPDPDLPWALADPRYAIAVRRSATELTGSGPFRIERIESGRVTLRAHDAHWSGRPFVDVLRVDLQRGPGAQLTDLEAGRADIVELQPADVRRVTERGLHVSATRPMDLLALVFEPHRSDATHATARQLFAGALDRTAIANVLLQNRGEPARSLLPSWLAGYAPDFVAPAIPRSARAAVAALPIEQRTLTLRVDHADPVARLIAERIAVDTREAGFTVSVQAPSGLAPRPDVRLVRTTLEGTTPDRSLARAVADLGSRLAASTPKDAAGAPALDATVRAERALLQDGVVIPVVRVPELYGLGEAVEVWDGDAIGAMGRWNFANVWMRTAPAARGRP